MQEVRARPLPQAVILDALGTLVALDPPAPALRAELDRRFGISVSLDAAERAISAEIAYYRGHLDEGRDRDSLRALRRRCAEVIRTSLPELGGVDPGELTSALLRSLQFRAYPDVLPALARLRGDGVRLVVASNWDVSLRQVLAGLRIEPLLDGIVTSAEAGTRKPAPGIFEQALHIAGVPAPDAVHVGDSPDEDVAGALGAGIEPVLIVRGDGRPPAGVRTITTLAEL